jgi:hypothetical protein
VPLWGSCFGVLSVQPLQDRRADQPLLALAHVVLRLRVNEQLFSVAPNSVAASLCTSVLGAETARLDPQSQAPRRAGVASGRAAECRQEEWPPSVVGRMDAAGAARDRGRSTPTASLVAASSA